MGAGWAKAFRLFRATDSSDLNLSCGALVNRASRFSLGVGKFLGAYVRSNRRLTIEKFSS